VALTARLPADTELALYRILQEALKNVAKHARARYVTVSLTQDAAFVQLAIQDDGIGFDMARRAGRRKSKERLGLLGMRERATFLGGVLTVRSTCRVGTEIKVRIPVVSGAAVAN
jgi:two-component system sensor histidine kinase DegS